MNEECLKAKTFIGEQPFAGYPEWGKKLIFFAMCKMLLEIETEEFIDLIQVAKKRVSRDVDNVA